MASAGGLILPLAGPYWGANAAFNAHGTVLDLSTDKNAWIFQAEAGISIARLGVRLQAKTGTSPTYSINLQGVNVSGLPDGTIKGGASPASATFTVTSWTVGTFNWVTLSNAYTCTRGELLALVVEHSSGTIDGLNNITLTASVNHTEGNFQFPKVTGSTGTWANHAATQRPIYGYGTSTRAYGWPLNNAGTVTYNSGTVGADEYAQRFVVPTWFCSTFTLRGIRVQSNFIPAQNMSFELSDATGLTYGTPLEVISLDGDLGGTSPSNDVAVVMFDASSLPVLNAGTPYRISQRPEGTTSTNIYWVDVASAADWEAFPPFGDQSVFEENALDQAGSWTQVTTRRLLMDLIFDDITPPTGGTNIFIPRRRIA